MNDEVKFSSLVGKTLKSVQVSKDKNEILFVTEAGEEFKMYHCQDCCESVYVEDICGSPDDLIGSPITQAEESTNTETKPPGYTDSFTWTFYRISTAKGQVVIRWLGESNGYYGESVDFIQTVKPLTAADIAPPSAPIPAHPFGQTSGWETRWV